jgi:hypothetical protein
MFQRYNFYLSPNIIGIIRTNRMRWTGHVARIGDKMNAYRDLVGKPEKIETTWKT